MASRYDDPAQFNDVVRFAKAPVFPPGAVFGNNQANPGDPLQPDKLYTRYQARLSQPQGSDAIAERRTVHMALAAGVVNAIKATLDVAITGADTVAVDVLKNGTSILSAPVSLTSGNAAGAVVNITPAVTAYAAGDRLAVVVTPAHSTGTLPRGLYVALDLWEQPA